MQTSIQIIEEIEDDSAGLQRKLLTLPAAGENLNNKQKAAIDKAQEGLLGWRGWDLGELKEAFKRKD